MSPGLPIIIVRNKMCENLRTATQLIEQGHVRVGPDVIKDPAFLVTRYTTLMQDVLKSSLVWLVSYYVAIAFSYTRVFYQPFEISTLSLPPFTVLAPNYVTVRKEEKRARKIVAPTKEMLLSFSCLGFLTNYDVRKRKQHFGLTILCILKWYFWVAIK